MKSQINLDGKLLFFSFVIGLLAIGLAGVYAYNPNGVGGNPALFGHSADELDWSSAISKLNVTNLCVNGSCKSSWPVFLTCDMASSYILKLSGWLVCKTDETGLVSLNGVGSGAINLVGGDGIVISKTVSPTGAAIHIAPSSQIYSLTCSNGQIPKWAGTAWTCGADIDTDTKCSTSGACSQVCIGSDCRTSWPASASGITSVNGATGPAVTIQSSVTSVSRSGNTITLGVNPATCTSGSNVYSVGAKCRSVYYCPTTGTSYYIRTCSASGWVDTNVVKQAYQDCPADPC